MSRRDATRGTPLRPGSHTAQNTRADRISFANDGGLSVGEREPRLLPESQPAEPSLVGECPRHNNRARLAAHAPFLPSQGLTSSAANSRGPNRAAFILDLDRIARLVLGVILPCLAVIVMALLTFVGVAIFELIELR